MTSPSITSLTLESAPPKLWAEWLWLWFDGSTHGLDAGSTAFPDVLLSFDQGDFRNRAGRIIEPISGTGISVVQQITPGREAYLNEEGRDCWDEAEYLFIIRSKIEGSKANQGNSNYQCRLVSELLHGLLNNDSALQPLAQKGLTHLEVGAVEVVPMDTHYTRTIRVKAELQYTVVTV